MQSADVSRGKQGRSGQLAFGGGPAASRPLSFHAAAIR